MSAPNAPFIARAWPAITGPVDYTDETSESAPKSLLVGTGGSVTIEDGAGSPITLGEGTWPFSPARITGVVAPVNALY